MKAHLVIVWHDGELKILSIDVKLVLTKLDDVLAIHEEFLAILKLAHGIFFQRF